MAGAHLFMDEPMNFYGTGQPLTRAGLSKALSILGLGPDDTGYIWTVVEVETASLTQGFGFRVDRRPQILFERHLSGNARTAGSIVKGRISPVHPLATDYCPTILQVGKSPVSLTVTACGALTVALVAYTILSRPAARARPVGKILN